MESIRHRDEEPSFISFRAGASYLNLIAQPAEQRWPPPDRAPQKAGAPRDVFAYTGAFMGKPVERNFCSSCTDHHWTTA